jgi:hypothetical protein
MKIRTGLTAALLGAGVLAAGYWVIPPGLKDPQGDYKIVQLVVSDSVQGAHLVITVSGTVGRCKELGDQPLPWTCITTAHRGALVKLAATGNYPATCEILAPNRRYAYKSKPGEGGCNIAGRNV